MPVSEARKIADLFIMLHGRTRLTRPKATVADAMRRAAEIEDNRRLLAA